MRACPLSHHIPACVSPQLPDRKDVSSWGMPQRHGRTAAENRGHGVDSGGSATDLVLALDMSQHPVRIGHTDRAVPDGQPDVFRRRPTTGSLSRRSALYTVVLLTPRTSPIWATVMSCCSYRRLAVRT